MTNPLPPAETVPLAERSLRLAVGTFADMAFTRDARQCRADAQVSRAQAVISAHPLLCLARAAWWEAVAARVEPAPWCADQKGA
ncbi:MAG: hypothetical protein ACRDRV_04650 [Pseudonocardiaceae bacterium]